MSISAASISHALHDLNHHGSTHRRAPAEQFDRQLGAAVQKTGQQSVGSQAANGTSNTTGGLLSADMLRQMQTIG